MRKNNTVRRRRFLVSAAAAATAASTSCTGGNSPWRVLSVEEAQTAAAVCEQLIPTDEFPGAAWAGAVDFIDRQLSGHLSKHRGAYRKGLAGIERASRERFGKPFAELPGERQTELLRAIEKTPFFALVLSHTMQSYYGDPRHGGNRDQVGYRSLGIPAAPVRGRFKTESAS